MDSLIRTSESFSLLVKSSSGELISNGGSGRTNSSTFTSPPSIIPTSTLAPSISYTKEPMAVPSTWAPTTNNTELDADTLAASGNTQRTNLAAASIVVGTFVCVTYVLVDMQRSIESCIGVFALAALITSISLVCAWATDGSLRNNNKFLNKPNWDTNPLPYHPIMMVSLVYSCTLIRFVLKETTTKSTPYDELPLECLIANGLGISATFGTLCVAAIIKLRLYSSVCKEARIEPDNRPLTPFSPKSDESTIVSPRIGMDSLPALDFKYSSDTSTFGSIAAPYVRL